MAMTRTTFLLCAIPLLLTSSLTAAQQGDGGAASGNIPAQAGGGDVAGAVGSSTGIASLSTGAIVAIAIVVTVAVVCGVLTAILFYQAKKRQWSVRDTLRHSTRRVTTGFKSVMSPLTPHRTTFSPDPFKSKSGKESKKMRGPSPLRRGEKNKGMGLDMDMETLNSSNNSSLSKTRDIEKGEGSQVVIDEMMRREKEKRTGTGMGNNRKIPSTNNASFDQHSALGGQQRPQKPTIAIPRTESNADRQVPKTPVYSRMFGRD